VPERIKSISVTLDTNAALPLVYARPKDALQAKFSLQFAAAVTIADGAAGLQQFSTERLRDQKLQKLMNQVRLVRRAPRGKHIGIETHVEITTQRGVTLGGRDSVARGHPSRPASRGDIEDKFRQCAGEILSPKQIAKFLQHFWAMEQAPSTAAWLGQLRPPRR
jgi:2-methylcitrate dehydratase PrpD